MAGWSLLLDYLLLPIINYLLIGIYMEAAFPAIPAWVFMIVSIVAVTVLNILGITAIAKANFVVVGLHALFIVLFVALGLSSITGTGSVDLLAPFTGAEGAEWLSPVFAGSAILCLSYLGFDAVSTFAEETKDPKRNLPRAIMITTILAGMIFLGLAYISHMVLPVSTFNDVDSAAIEVIGAAGGELLVAFFGRLHCRQSRVSVDLPSLGLADHSFDGPQRSVPCSVGAAARPLQHAGAAHPADLRRVATGFRVGPADNFLADQLRCPGCLLRGQRGRHQALLLRPERPRSSRRDPQPRAARHWICADVLAVDES